MGSRAESLGFSRPPVFKLLDLVTWECLGARWWGRRCGRSSLLWQGCSASGFPRGGVSLLPCCPCPQPSSSSSRPEHFHMSSQPSGTGTQGRLGRRQVGRPAFLFRPLVIQGRDDCCCCYVC